MLTSIAFYILAAITLILAVFVLVLRNPAHSVMSLVGMMLTLSGIFLALKNPFIAAIQVLVYAGAVMVLFLFAIMILNLRNPESQACSSKGCRCRKMPALLFGLLFLLQTVLAASFVLTSGPENRPEVPVKEIFMAIMTKYLLPFELISVLALIAIVGAVMISMQDKELKEEK